MKKIRTIVLGAALLASMAAAGADVRYTTEMSMDINGQQQTVMTSTTSIKGQRERVDMSMSFGPMKMQQSSITMCDLHQNVDMSAATKMYTVSPINPMNRILGPMARKKGGHQTGTGQVVTTVTVQDMGTEKIGKYDTRHYVVSMQIQASGCAGDDNSSYKSEVWVAPGNVAFNCGEATKPSQVVDDNGCKITYVMKGDFQKMGEIERNLIVQRKFDNPQQQGGSMLQRLTEYSTATLSDADFQIPGDYKKVSTEEYQQALSRSMMPQR